MPRKIALIFFSFLLLSSPAFAASRLIVVASFSILGNLAHKVGGDAIDLHTLVGPDSDAHIYEPSPEDLKTLGKARIILINGLGFEGWLNRIIPSAQTQIITVSGAVHAYRLPDGSPDPHAWQDVRNAMLYVAAIRNAFCAADPAHAALFNDNTARYLAQLSDLDRFVTTTIAAIPPQKRIAITSHDALGYFARAYGIRLIAPMGLSTSASPSAHDIARLIDQIRVQHIRAVFLENMTSPNIARELAEDGGAIIGGTLYSDALSAPSGPAGTYLFMMRHNAQTLADALGRQ
jgi:zinc/manganese transport system substrate-binding protein